MLYEKMLDKIKPAPKNGHARPKVEVDRIEMEHQENIRNSKKYFERVLPHIESQK